jgi:predicted Zn finger-like uncharacterized protein
VEKIITQCPHCQAKFKLPGDKVGKRIRCPKCKEVFAVEILGGAPKPAAPAAPKPQPAPAPKPAPAPEPAPAPAAAEVVPIEDRPRPLQPKDFFETQHMRFLPEKAQGVDAYIWYELTGDGGGSWTVKIHNGASEVKEASDPAAKTHVRMSAKTYMKIAMGKLDSRVAFMLGKIKIKGDKQSVVSVRECFYPADVK